MSLSNKEVFKDALRKSTNEDPILGALDVLYSKYRNEYNGEHTTLEEFHEGFKNHFKLICDELIEEKQAT